MTNNSSNTYIIKNKSIASMIEVYKLIIRGELSMINISYRNNVTNDFKKLSRREYQVLELMVLGRTNKDIAVELDITINAVKYHIKNIMFKTSIRDRREFIELNAKGQIWSSYEHC